MRRRLCRKLCQSRYSVRFSRFTRAEKIMFTMASYSRRFAGVLFVLAFCLVVVHADAWAKEKSVCKTCAAGKICASCAKLGLAKPNCPSGTWCEGCARAKCTCCDDYCRKPAPCIQLPKWCGVCPDYCRKCLPAPPCRVQTTCDDYCRKPCPVCPMSICPVPICPAPNCRPNR
jgi:hypothetical protein